MAVLRCRPGACDIFQLFLLRLYRLIILLFFKYEYSLDR